MEGFKDSFFDPVKVASAWKKLSLELESQAAGLKQRGKRIKEIVPALKLQRLSNQSEVLQIPSCLKQ